MARSKSINKKKILALVLMAGKGTRMKSDTPKVLHPVMGKPMGWYVLDAIAKAGITRRLVVVGYGAEMVQKTFPDEKFVLQKPQSGTGHAVLIARDSIPKDVSHILVINGDSPLLTPKAVKSVVALLGKRNCNTVVSCDWTPNPSGLGRIIFDESDNFVAIRESSDLKRDEKHIEWVNVGLYGFEKKTLFEYLDRINSKNKQRELYLTDIPGLMVKDKHGVEVYTAEDDSFLVMPNNRADIADASSIIQHRILDDLMKKGVSIIDPRQTYIEQGVKIARDVTIYPETYIMGKTTIGKDSKIGPMTTITDSKIAANVKVRMSSLEEARIDTGCVVGPFSHLRPNAHLKKGSRVGNFCEVKKSVIGENSKVNHLSYIGDATLGMKVNIGAGTITCNYDGTHKHKTFIGDNAFIGSDSILVAPIKIGANTLTGAGSVITRDIPPGQTAMGVPARVIRKTVRKTKSEK